MEQNIQSLLDKYFEEKTSAAEEQTLRNYFAQDVIAPELEVYRSVFQYVASEKEQSLGQSFEQKVLGSIVGDLTEKYFAGETTEAEEEDLRQYFLQNQVPGDLFAFQSWFKFLSAEKSMTVSPGFTDRLVQRIEAQATDQTSNLLEKYFAAETSLAEEEELKAHFSSTGQTKSNYGAWFTFLKEEQQETVSADFDNRVLTEVKGKSGQLRVVSRRSSLMRIAAGFALLLGALFLLQRGIDSSSSEMADTKTVDWSKYEVKTEAEAIAETEEAMRILAKAFGKSSKKAAKDLHKVGEATKVIKQ